MNIPISLIKHAFRFLPHRQDSFEAKEGREVRINRFVFHLRRVLEVGKSRKEGLQSRTLSLEASFFCLRGVVLVPNFLELKVEFRPFWERKSAPVLGLKDSGDLPLSIVVVLLSAKQFSFHSTSSILRWNRDRFSRHPKKNNETRNVLILTPVVLKLAFFKTKGKGCWSVTTRIAA